jgi:outer membrane protein OmpA-like peptidoglycan-associated protein
MNLTAAAVLARAFGCAGILLLLASCQSTTMEPPGVQEPPMSGVTNEPAPGYTNMQAGSEEDFILNVGRRTFFTQGSAALDSVARTTLDGQIAWLNKYPNWLVKLQGFADDSGSESAQVSLSQKRADAVMAYLAAGGVAQSRMWGKGYGKDREVRDCPDKACKVQNRRVVTNLRNERDTP